MKEKVDKEGRKLEAELLLLHISGRQLRYFGHLIKTPVRHLRGLRATVELLRR